MPSDHVDAYQQGRRHGLAIAAIACSTLAFVSLLGIEKAILALVLAILACHGPATLASSRRLALVATGIAIIYIITYVVVLVVYHAQVMQLVHLLQKLG